MVTMPPEKPVDESPVRWSKCEDVRVLDDDGAVIYSGPKYLRCKRSECNGLTTHAMAHQGGCWCGNRRLGVALRLTTEERSLLKRGYYPLCAWELELIKPTVPPGLALGWGKADYHRRNG